MLIYLSFITFVNQDASTVTNMIFVLVAWKGMIEMFIKMIAKNVPKDAESAIVYKTLHVFHVFKDSNLYRVFVKDVHLIA